MNDQKKDTRKDVGALWQKENEHGVFFSGKISCPLLDGQNIILVPNNKREGFNEKSGRDFNDPDFRLFIFVKGEQ